MNPSIEDLDIHNVFISRFLNELWKWPEAIYEILKNSDDNVVKANLAPFIVNNFYCNYLSENYMENNLLYVITLMLKDEIDNLENINQVDTFLENTKCGYVLEEFQKFPDIQIYFKNVIFKTVEKLERTCSFREFNFSVSERIEEFKKLKEAEDKRLNRKNSGSQEDIYTKLITNKVLDPSLNFSKDENSKKNKERNDMFVKKYVPNINNKDLEERANEAKKNNKKNLYDFFKKISNKLETNADLYSNKEVMKNMLMSKIPTFLLTFYQNDFLDVIPFIEQLIEDLMKNILLLPNSIKCICKIISILIRKKFKNIPKYEEIAFISKFLMGKLLMPIISFPSFNALISDYVISGNTLKNIKIINYIVNTLFSGKLFKNDPIECDYTPFNWFFLSKIEEVLSFYEKTTVANLPDFIDKLVNDKLPKDYTYEYFKENKGQIYTSISVCFNINDLFNLLDGIKNSPDLLKTIEKKSITLKRCIDRLDPEENRKAIKIIDENLIVKYRDELKRKPKYKEKYQTIEIENYFLYNAKEIEKEYENLFTLNNKITNFYIDIKKKTLEEKEKKIIKVKNYLCSSLGNYRLLNKSDFNMEEEVWDTTKILNNIKTYMSLPNFILNNNTIPSIWYINSILDYLKKIPEDYKKNDYKKLFIELTKNLNDAINALDFEILIQFRNKLKFLNKNNDYYSNAKHLMSAILMNENIKHFVEEVSIPIDVYYKYDESDKKFELTKSNIKEKLFEDRLMYEDPKKKILSFKTIEAFTRYFPNLAKYQIVQGINPLNIIQELSINNKLIEYYQIIKEKIKIIKHNMNKSEKQAYEEKIIDYIMNKIYEKIYPPEPDDKDTEIFKKSMQLSWLEPNFFLKKDYIYDNMLPDILNEFKKINLVKTPYRKYNCLKTIIQYINSLIKFNEGLDKENIGAEDVTPILNYIFIKAHPFKIYTDLEFIKVFFTNNGRNDYLLNQIESIYNLVLSYTPNSFNLTNEEYRKRCYEAINSNQNNFDNFNRYY